MEKSLIKVEIERNGKFAAAPFRDIKRGDRVKFHHKDTGGYDGIIRTAGCDAYHSELADDWAITFDKFERDPDVTPPAPKTIVA